MGLFSKMKSGWLAVGFASDRFSIAHVQASPLGKPEITLCDSFRKEGDEQKALERLRRALHLQHYRCTTFLNPGDYQIIQLDSPNVPTSELKAALRWKVKDMLDYPIDSATIDALEIPAEGKSARSIFAIAARNEKLSSRIQLFQQAKIPLQAIDIAEVTQRNIAHLFEIEGRGLAMLAFNDNGGLLTFTYRGELYLSRWIELSLTQLSEAKDEQLKLYLERIVLELQRSLDHFDRQYRFITLSGMLLAPTPPQIGLEKYLLDNLGMAVETLDLTKVINVSAIPELRQPLRQAQCLQIIGAALRSEAPT